MNDESKPNIGLLTMHRVKNYGSILQAFALQNKIESLGYRCELIDYFFPNVRKLSGLKKWKRALRNVVGACLGAGTSGRDRRFDAFAREHMRLSTEKYRTGAEFAAAKLDYDMLLTGSDQVWSPHHVKDDLSFLFPGDDNLPRVSYAASFGKGEVPERLRAEYGRLLARYGAISLRERSGVDVVKDLSGKDASFVCDPTLLLSKEEWSTFARAPRRAPRRPYLLAYILTYSFAPYPQVYQYTRALADKLNLDLVVLKGRRGDRFRSRTLVYNDCGPQEFIHLFKNASFVTTTSFHGTAFALNFEKPFYSFVRRSSDLRDDRVSGLLAEVGLENRALNDRSPLPDDLALDYSSATPKLRAFREDSLAYLKSAIAQNL